MCFRQRGCWGLLGYSVEVIEPAHSRTLRGTAVMTNSLAGMWCGSSGQDGNTSGPELASAFAPPEASVRVKVRGCASRRAVKQAVDTAEAEARSRSPNNWWTGTTSMSGSPWRSMPVPRQGEARIHILDSTTHIEVPLETGTYECSGVSKR